MLARILLALLCFTSLTLAAAVEHPCLTVKKEDLARAAENQKRYPWVREYVATVRRVADEYALRFTPAFVEHMLEVTTPLSTIFTPCPACRDQGKTWHPHGQWNWNVDEPDCLKCELCGAVFPDAKYPESVVVKSSWGAPQTFTFIGGEPFAVFGYEHCRPSVSGNIRARKVAYVIAAMGDLTSAYFLTGDEKYARTLRLILLRFAEVYPHWLIHEGYGEFADCDPRIAAGAIDKLPMDELVYPPNVPDRALHTGFWSAGRATGHGQESYFVKAAARAYDAIYSSGVLTESEKGAVEEKVLLESTILLVADKKINNKSVGNRAAVAMVGLVTGHRDLVDFGVEGFHKTIDEWFLKDGGTPESPAYAMMAFSNTLDLPLAMRELYREPAYARAWRTMVEGLQGDCTLAPYADTRANTRFGAVFAELLGAHYPERAQYLALRKELCEKPPAEYAIYYREPRAETTRTPALSFLDMCPPDLRIGHMRTGADGRESLVLLNASHWGGHHHCDSLNLYYWKNGQELLSDLGYLWDNPQKRMTTRVFAHNTVVIDEQEQRSTDRGGDVKFFKSSSHVKTMRASSNAYAQAKHYERTVALIDHGGGRSYVADFFIVEGGHVQDYVFHGPNMSFSTDLSPPRKKDVQLYDLTSIRRLESDRIAWEMPGKEQFVAFLPPQRGEHVFVGDGWGQRDSFNKDRGATLPYIVRRTTGGGAKLFAAVFAAHSPGEPFVRGVKRVHRGNLLALEVQTALGTDYIESHPKGLNVTSKTGGKINWTFIHEQ